MNRRALNNLAAEQVFRGLHFEGKVQRVDWQGNVCLEDVMLPVGEEPYCWIPGNQWHGKRPHVGDPVRGVADLRGYLHKDGQPGISLGNARMLQVGL